MLNVQAVNNANELDLIKYTNVKIVNKLLINENTR